MSCNPALANRSPGAAARAQQCRKQEQASPFLHENRNSLTHAAGGKAASWAGRVTASTAGSCQQPWMHWDHSWGITGVHWGCSHPPPISQGPGRGPGFLGEAAPWPGGSCLSLSLDTPSPSHRRIQQLLLHHTNTDPASSAAHDTHSVALQKGLPKVPKAHTAQGVCHTDLGMATAAHTTAPGKLRAAADSSNQTQSLTWGTWCK